MAVSSVSCPGCQKVLKMSQAPRGNLRCPRCQARFRATEEGETALVTEVSGSQVPCSRIGVLAAVAGGGALFVALGVALLVYCLQTPTPKEPEDEAEDDPYHLSQPVRSLPVVRVGFKKKGPLGAGPVAGTLAQGRYDANWPAAVAKEVCAAEAMSPANQMKIDNAFDKGFAYLKKSFDDQGRPVSKNAGPNSQLVGCAALVGLTFMTCGMDAEDPKLKGIAARVRKEAPQLLRTYEVACCIWFFDKLGQTSDLPLVRQLALRSSPAKRRGAVGITTCLRFP